MSSLGFQVTPGVPLNMGLAFRALTVIIDNFTDSFLYIPDAGRYVEPQCTRCILAVSGTPVAQVQWLAPPGQTQPTADSSQQATVIFTDEVRTLSAGMLGLRPSYYDRNPLSIALNYAVQSLVNHAATARWTYTVPTRRRAFVEEISCSIILEGAGDGALLFAQTFVSITPFNAAETAVIGAYIQGTAPVRTTARSVIGTSMELQSGERIRAFSQNAYIAALVTPAVACKISEFDA